MRKDQDRLRAFLFGLGIGVFGIVILFLIVDEHRTSLMLKKDGVITSGQIIRKDRKGAPNAIYITTYEWAVDDQRFERTIDNDEVYFDYELGERLPVRYLPANPGVGRLEEYELNEGWDVGTVGGIIFGLVSVFIGGIAVLVTSIG
jgi:hypothetical protein